MQTYFSYKLCCHLFCRDRSSRSRDRSRYRSERASRSRSRHHSERRSRSRSYHRDSRASRSRDRSRHGDRSSRSRDRDQRSTTPEIIDYEDDDKATLRRQRSRSRYWLLLSKKKQVKHFLCYKRVDIKIITVFKGSSVMYMLWVWHLKHYLKHKFVSYFCYPKVIA